MNLRNRYLRISAWLAFATASFGPREAAQGQHADFFMGTGDHYVVADFFPVDSPAFIDAMLDVAQSMYGTQRIYWRGLQDQTVKQSLIRPEAGLIPDWFDYINDLDDQGLNQYAVQAAHARGMEIWGRGAIYDWGDEGNTTTTNLVHAGSYESNLRINNPEWEPIDRFGIRRQSGPLEFGYAAARQAAANMLTQISVDTGYDGVALQLYNENYSTRFADEFGFSDPVVQDFQTRYGVNLRRARSLTPTQIQAFRDLRGEYTTAFLDELHTQLNANGIELSMEANGYTDPSIPSLWLLDSPYPETGVITQEWKKWVDEGTVDELWLRRGITSPGGIEVYNYAENTSVGVSAFASNPLNSAFNSAEAKGVTMIGTSLELVEVIRNGNMPSQGLSALTSSDPNRRMKVLQQIITGNTAATPAQVTPLVNDSNILVRRLALEALGSMGTSSVLPTLENALTDPENGIRTGALLALKKLNASTPQTMQKILDALPLGNSPAMLEEARYVLLNMPASTTDPVLVDALVQSPHDEVRKLAARTLYGRIVTTPGLLDAYMQASSDPDPYVRFYAVMNQYYVSPTSQSVDGLVALINGNDTVTSNAAADVLGAMMNVGYSAVRTREAELVGVLTDRFADFGDRSTEPHADWGYESVGRALLASTSYFGGPGTGRQALRDFMTQRSDRLLSERAWEMLHIVNDKAKLNVTTFEASEQAFLRRPRWDSVVAVLDDFDSSPGGTLLVNHQQAIGQGWTVEAGADPNAQDIQSAVNNGGKALRLFRPANSPTSHTVRARGHIYDVSVAELTEVTLRADWQRRDGDESALLSLDIGNFAGIDPTVFANADGNYWVSNGSGYINTSFPVGEDGWETIELVVTWGIAANDKVGGTYDVFLTRDSQNSLGALPRTLIANDLAISPANLAESLDIVISNQPGGVGDVITYWDNVSLRLDPILDGDFDLDGVVDGTDFLAWQRNPTATNLTNWKASFGQGASALGNSHSVPEPSSMALSACCLLFALSAPLWIRRWSNSSPLESVL